MNDVIRILKVLSDKNRLRIVALLSKKKMCVCELAYVIGVTQPSISRHIKKMKKAGLIAEEQDGFWTNYHISISGNKEKEIFDCINKWSHSSTIARNDIRKLKNFDRRKLCCK